MKILTVLFTLFVIWGSALSQSDLSKYMPLATGNKWVYKMSYSGSMLPYTEYVASEITGDTTINSKHYYKCTNFWGDSSLTFIRYDSLSGWLMKYMNSAGCDHESYIIQFNAQPGDSENTQCAQFVYYYIGENDTVLFNTNTFVKSYGKAFTNYYCIHQNRYSLIYGIGPSNRFNSTFCRSGYTTDRQLLGAYIDGAVYGDTTVLPSEYNITGTVRFEDNNETVKRGYVKAFKHSGTGGDLVLFDSAHISTSGRYTLKQIPTDTIDLMAFDDDEVVFYGRYVPTYYPSTIDWRNAVQLYPTANLSNVDIRVFRIPDSLYAHKIITGNVYVNRNLQSQSGLKDAIIYAKSGDEFLGFAVSNSTGYYKIGMLPDGMYSVICGRLGYPELNRNVILGPNASYVDFYYGDVITGTNEGSEIPSRFELKQNYPNPFNPVTKFKFGLPGNAHLNLAVYDVLGKEISLIVSGDLKAGYYDVSWDATPHPSGVYFYRLTAGDYSETKKMVLLK